MVEARWILHDAAGAEMGATEAFASREEAEAWMSTEWSGLREEGAESVSLLEGDETIYQMGLGEE